MNNYDSPKNYASRLRNIFTYHNVGISTGVRIIKILKKILHNNMLMHWKEDWWKNGGLNSEILRSLLFKTSIVSKEIHVQMVENIINGGDTYVLLNFIIKYEIQKYL